MTTNVVTSPFALSDRYKHVIQLWGRIAAVPTKMSADGNCCRKPTQHLRDHQRNGRCPSNRLPPISMGVFAYPHREGAKLTLDIILGKLDGEEDPGNEYILVVKDRNFIMNMRTVPRKRRPIPRYGHHDGPRCALVVLADLVEASLAGRASYDRAVLMAPIPERCSPPWNVFQLRCLVLC